MMKEMIYISMLIKRLKDHPFDTVKELVQKSALFFTKRIAVTWAGYSLVKAELILLEEAIKKQHAYYHLISGVDMPIKSQDYIHEFFNKNDGKEYIDYKLDENVIQNNQQRVKYYYMLQEKIGN